MASPGGVRVDRAARIRQAGRHGATATEPVRKVAIPRTARVDNDYVLSVEAEVLGQQVVYLGRHDQRGHYQQHGQAELQTHKGPAEGAGPPEARLAAQDLSRLWPRHRPSGVGAGQRGHDGAEDYPGQPDTRQGDLYIPIDEGVEGRYQHLGQDEAESQGDGGEKPGLRPQLGGHMPSVSAEGLA